MHLGTKSRVQSRSRIGSPGQYRLTHFRLSRLRSALLFLRSRCETRDHLRHWSMSHCPKTSLTYTVRYFPHTRPRCLCAKSSSLRQNLSRNQGRSSILFRSSISAEKKNLRQSMKELFRLGKEQWWRLRCRTSPVFRRCRL